MSHEILSSLTAERLDELAAGERNLADQLEAQGDAEQSSWPDLAVALREDAAHHRQLAAICEALAKAHRALQADERLSVEYGTIDDTGVSGFMVCVYSGAADRGGFPTLLAALGSVGQQEKHDG